MCVLWIASGGAFVFSSFIGFYPVQIALEDDWSIPTVRTTFLVVRQFAGDCNTLLQLVYL
jgi:hypothetical protein